MCRGDSKGRTSYGWREGRKEGRGGEGRRWKQRSGVLGGWRKRKRRKNGMERKDKIMEVEKEKENRNKRERMRR